MLPTLSEFRHTREQIALVFDELAVLAGEVQFVACQHQLKEWSGKIRENRFRLLVIGDFKRGKSTLLNALLGKRVLPTAMRPCTGGITIIRDGSPQRAVINYWPGENGEPARGAEEIDLNEFRQRIVISAGEGEGSSSARTALRETSFRDISLYLDTKLCRDGVELVDSPGLNEDRLRTELTQSFIPIADAGIFVLSAQQLLSENEQANIQSFRRMGLREFFFVVNFWDAVEQSDDPAREARELKARAEKILSGLVGDSPRIVYVSSAQAMKAREAGDLADYSKSAFADFESELKLFLTRDRARIQLERYLSALENLSREVKDLLDQRLGLLGKSIEELEEVSKSANKQYELIYAKISVLREKVLGAGLRASERMEKELRDHIQEMIAVLPDESRNWTSETSVSSGDLQAVAQDYVVAAQAYIRTNLEAFVESYARPEITEALNKVTTEVLPDLEALRKEILATTQTPVSEVVATQAGDATGVGIMRTEIELGDIRVKGDSGLLVAVGAARSPAVFAAAGAAMVASIFLPIASIPLAIAAFFGSGLLGGLVAQLPFAGLSIAARKARVRDAVVAKAMESLQEMLQKAPAICAQAVRNQFASHATDIAGTLDRLIDSSKAQLAEVLRKQREISTEADNGKQRVMAQVERIEKSLQAGRSLVHGYIQQFN